MHRAAAALALVLLAVPLTGCITGEDTSASGLDTESQASFSRETGGIEGVVTDEAIQPLEGVTVRILETGEAATTTSDGSFAFSNVQPGTYTLVLEADGFLGTEREIDVASAEVTTIEIVLAHEPSVTPYIQQFEFNGFLECSAAIPDALTPPSPYGAVAVCAIPNFLLGGNATNDRFMFEHGIEQNPWQIVTELTWDASNPTTQEMSLVVEAEGFSNNNSATFSESSQGDPIILSADRERIGGVVDNLTSACESGDDDSCNRNYVEDGGPIQIRVFVDATELEPGLAVQQDYTLYNTIFYNAPACPNYSIVEDERCAQDEIPPEQDPYQNPE